jgi:hypothetical protein
MSSGMLLLTQSIRQVLYRKPSSLSARRKIEYGLGESRLIFQEKSVKISLICQISVPFTFSPTAC